MNQPTGAAELPEALRPIQRYKIGYSTDDWGMRSSSPSGIPDTSGPWVRYADHVAQVEALSAAQAGVPADAVGWIDDEGMLFWKGDPLPDGSDIYAAPQPTPSPAPAPGVPNWLQYDQHTDVLTINGKRYAAAMFGESGFLAPTGTLLRVELGQPDCVTLSKVAPAQEPVHGDLLPPVGSRVFIRHGRDDDAHACTVTGYYAWGDLGGDKRLHRVFVRLVYEGATTPQARMLCDCYPTAEAALAANTHPFSQPAVTAGAVDALCDSQYAEGMLLGWNLCIAGDDESFRKIRGQRMTAALAAQREVKA